jgi:hypothetical protein
LWPALTLRLLLLLTYLQLQLPGPLLLLLLLPLHCSQLCRLLQGAVTSCAATAVQQWDDLQHQQQQNMKSAM